MKEKIRIPKCNGCWCYTCWYCEHGKRENSTQVSCAHDFHMHSRSDSCRFFREDWRKTNGTISEEQID